MSELKPEFEAKLRKARVLTRWKKNFNKYFPEAKSDYGYLNDADCFSDFIKWSFIWDDTPEGFAFWEKISQL